MRATSCGAALLGVAIAIAPAARGSAAPPGEGSLAAAIAKVDEAWPSRDREGKLEEARAALERADQVAPDDFEVLWRWARYYAWVSDDPARDAKERRRLGRAGWERGDRAAAKEPSRVEGHLFAALGVGNYALGIGVLKALREGIEGKFKSRLARAEAIDPEFLAGTIPTAWGRFYYELPWPKYDATKSEANLRWALRVNPANVRARVYLAELYLKEGRRDAARNLLSDALRAEPGKYDAPEERRMQARARGILSNVE